MGNGARLRIVFVASVALAGGCSSDADEPDLPFADDDGDEATEAGEAGEGGESGEQGGDGDGEPAPEQSMPDNAYCQSVAEWSEAWDAHADQVIALINAARAAGGDCGVRGNFAPAPPLQGQPALTCAARVHASDMAEHDFFDPKSSDGHDPSWRYEQAGFTGSAWAEILGAGYPSPATAVEGWLASEDYCAKLLDPSAVGIGVGYAFDPDSSYEHYWVLSLGGL